MVVVEEPFSSAFEQITAYNIHHFRPTLEMVLKIPTIAFQTWIRLGSFKCGEQYQRRDEDTHVLGEGGYGGGSGGGPRPELDAAGQPLSRPICVGFEDCQFLLVGDLSWNAFHQ